MLKINLLPIRQLKKRAKALNQIYSAVLALVCVLVLLGLVAYVQSGTITSTKGRIASLVKEKKKYEPILRRIELHKKNTQELERRIKVINKLQTNSSLTVHVLDEVTKRTDTERVWLTSLSQQGGGLHLSGVALDNETVAQYMDSLKASPYIKYVNLGSSSLKNIAGKNLKVFSISCSIGQPPPPAKKDATKAKATTTAKKK